MNPMAILKEKVVVGVRVRIGPDVAVTLLPDGTLRLFSEPASTEYVGGPDAAAMWVALGQHHGDCRAAADRLADVWDTDPTYTRASMELWIEELCALSLVRIEIS